MGGFIYKFIKIYIFCAFICAVFADSTPKKEQTEPDIKYTPPHPSFRPKQSTKIPFEVIPLFFVTGHPRSGTTLLRAMLDAHPYVRCGEETHVVPTLSSMWDDNKVLDNKKKDNLKKVGLTDEVLTRAAANFLFVVILEHGEKAHVLCNKDPLVMTSGQYVNKLFPKSKFIFMLRDARASVHSLISRNVTIGGFDMQSYERSLGSWNRLVGTMYEECQALGSAVCLPVYYEQLILNTKKVMFNIMAFMGLPWSDNVMHHQDFVGKEGGIKLSPKEMSTNQVEQARYVNALTAWVGKLPEYILPYIDYLAPMNKLLGYGPTAFPPDYNKVKKFDWKIEVPKTSQYTPPKLFFQSVAHHNYLDTKYPYRKMKIKQDTMF